METGGRRKREGCRKMCVGAGCGLLQLEGGQEVEEREKNRCRQLTTEEGPVT